MTSWPTLLSVGPRPILAVLPDEDADAHVSCTQGDGGVEIPSKQAGGPESSQTPSDCAYLHSHRLLPAERSPPAGSPALDSPCPRAEAQQHKAGAPPAGLTYGQRYKNTVDLKVTENSRAATARPL